MDNVLVDFKHALRERELDPDMNDADEIGGIFSEMIPMKGAVDAFHALITSDKYDVTYFQPLHGRIHQHGTIRCNGSSDTLDLLRKNASFCHIRKI